MGGQLSSTVSLYRHVIHVTLYTLRALCASFGHYEFLLIVFELTIAPFSVLLIMVIVCVCVCVCARV